ncbi:hypothetical protein DLJ96_17935 [Actinotalea fermentans ATCC 43279 = JCM 9966 = DSM 3133]|nr:hypothetical protein DLJ96_17935 [Actinotalea fermentans ATCC 43279 = JCM 9966 = DSM 3133]
MMTNRLLLTEDTVELVMRLLLSGAIDRTIACQLVTPWVVGDLPSTRLAESGAQAIHGFDLVRVGGREHHPSAPDREHDFLFDDREVATRCHTWLVRGRETESS